MKKMYHLHRHPKDTVPEFEVGKSYTVFNEGNHFWNFYASYSPSIQMANGHICGPSKFAYYCYEQNAIDKNGLFIISEIMKETGMMLRELIFEEIRLKEYPSSPSRQKCIWLTEKETIKFWHEWLDDKINEISIIEMECDGIFHTGNQSFLFSDIDSYQNYVNSARNYWSSFLVNTSTNNETIFNGEVKILDINKYEDIS